uniref:Centromere-associated protein E n=1 Tax=Fundulus heteroclitus TaxID=8078 RepID=A0A3Q2QUU6_FUNHE
MEVELEVMRKEEIILQKKLENVDHTTAQLIMKIISIMEELREQQPTTGEQQLDILTLLHNYKQDYIKALTEIKNLKELLSQTRKPDLDLQVQYNKVKARLEQTIAELKNSGDSDTALILTVLNLHDEIKALRERISTSTDTNDIARLQRLLREKQEELNSKTEDIERLIPNPQIILTIIELQNNIRELQSDTNATTGEMTALQQRLKGLLSELESEDQESTKQMMTILALQNEIKYLQTLLSNAEVSQSHTSAQLKNQLEAKQVELDKVFREMRERNQTNGNLLVTISFLQSQLRQLENKRETEGETTSATVSKLKEQLKIKEEESQEQQALIKTLQIALNQTEAQCSLDKQKIQDLQNDLDTKLQKLNSTSNTVTSLALQVSTLTAQLEELKAQLENSVSSSKVEELQRTVEQKSAELDKKVEELRQKSTQAQRFLQIIALQVDIERQTIVASNETDYAKVRALQDHLNYLIEGIQDTDSENTKLTFQILAHQDELERLKKERESQLGAHVKKIKDLENELESVRAQIKEKTNLLGISTTRVANLSAQIMELREKIPLLQEEISDLKQTYEENYSELQERFNFTKTKLQNTEFQLKHADEKNFKLIMEISDLRAQLKKAKEQTSRASKKSIAGLEQQLRTQEAANRKLESRNRDLKQRVEELEMRCNANTDCEDLRRQLEQSQEDADRLHRQLQEKDAALKKLQSDFELQRQEKDKLQENYDGLVTRLTDVEDRTIYNTKITWDPLTAHPRIALSAGNTEVSTTEDVLQVQDNPGRFSVVLGVLGSSGFSRGRHYWEVSVAEKRCYHIGMASESAKRKGSIAFKPSEGYWTIILNKQGQLKAIDMNPVLLQVERLPITLGILLDYNRGQISFYDSGARSHLYSFSGQKFTDKIYPFLNYCVEEVENPQPITLLPPGSTDWIV